MQVNFNSRRFKYGSTATLLTVLVIVAVLLVNAIFSALADRFLLYTDLTSEYLYTLSDSAKKSIENIDKDVTILFCNDPDNLEANATQRYVYRTALELEKANKYVHVRTVNIFRNPSAVNYYKTNSKSNIYSTSIIVYSGTEYRVLTTRSMFVFNTATDEEPWSYNGEKRLCATILAVTKAESPICCITYNHGEPFVAQDDLEKTQSIIDMLEMSGFRVQALDLSKDEIPADCRLVFVYKPLDDFLTSRDGISDVDEIEKIDKFLDGTNSLMVFEDPTTKPLRNLEEYLEEWGIVFDRHEDNSGEKSLSIGMTIQDVLNSVTKDGQSLVGNYVTKGAGSSFTNDLRTTYPPKVIFPNAMGISYARNYKEETVINDETNTIDFTIYSYTLNGIYRSIFNVFDSFPSAIALANGTRVKSATDLHPFHLLTVTRETRMVDNTNSDYSFVVASGSTEFLSKDLIESNSYGNSDVMLNIFHTMGLDTAIVEIDHKPFASTKMENITTAQADGWTIALIVTPVVLSLGCGIYILVRRKYAL